MLKLLIPKDLLNWLDENKGDKSRSAYIIDLLFEIKKNNT